MSSALLALFKPYLNLLNPFEGGPIITIHQMSKLRHRAFKELIPGSPLRR